MDNIVQMGRWKADQNLEKLRKPVDKDKWSTEPAVVNAFYDPNKNDIGMQSCVQGPVNLIQVVAFSVPCGNPPALILQSIFPKVPELWGHWGGHWVLYIEY